MTLAVRSLTAHVFRAPLATPVVTSFGTMRDRPMVLVRAEDNDGGVGWGETWCNFPAVGAEHRARLVESVLAPLLRGAAFADPCEAFALLTRRTEVLALQAAEPGPLAQAIAGTDIALWDLFARRAGQPLWRLLGGADPVLPVYASGINPNGAAALAAARRADGHRAFKLKLGFGRTRDLANLGELRDLLGPTAPLAADVNQGWSIEEARAMLPALADFDLLWLEEPVRTDTPWPEWRRLAEAAPMPLAAGENLLGEAAFEAALASGALGIVQPDVAKWGGLSGCLPLARRIRAAGLRYCPHYLGGGAGLLASAHLLAAVGGDGILEVDANDNPLRSLTCGPLATVVDGYVTLTEMPGLGAEIDLADLRPFATMLDPPDGARNRPGVGGTP